jgi:UrcA family protein
MNTHSSSHRATQIVLSGLAAISCGLAGAADFAASPFDKVQSETVRFAELDLSKQAGAKVLYRRIQNAAIDVCGGRKSASEPIARNRVKEACYKTAVASAVEKVGSPLLVALHEAKTQRKTPRLAERFE